MKSLGKYQVVRLLAQFGDDEAFLARTVETKGAEYHVLRWLPARAFESARRAAWLRHPNLVAIRELGAEGSRSFLATEYVHGEDLRRLMKLVRRADDQVPIALVTAIGAAVAAGLHHAHTHQGSKRARHGSIHGALCPSRILIGYDGSVKVADLGVEAAADASYLAPEQASDDDAPIDRRTDVFALGVVLYELATARRLFKAPNDYLTHAAILHACIPPPSRFRRGLPRALESIIVKAIAPAPADRFKSAGELGAALEAFASGIGMRLSQEGIADYLKKMCGSRPFPWVVTPAAARPRAPLAQITEELPALRDEDQPGVAAPPEEALRELGVPEARELEVTPSHGTKTPMAWMRQSAPAQPWSQRRVRALLAGAAAAAAILAFVIVGAVVRSGGAGGSGGSGGAVVPAIAPSPPPPPPPPSVVIPDVSDESRGVGSQGVLIDPAAVPAKPAATPGKPAAVPAKPAAAPAKPAAVPAAAPAKPAAVPAKPSATKRGAPRLRTIAVSMATQPARTRRSARAR
ncbi:MAG TPA: serine/threonine-protein kinase [Kofleriaceae bacterium]|nr:serine/threonine-protein kinase [Kofleriaceae bacterium]